MQALNNLAVLGQIDGLYCSRGLLSFPVSLLYLSIFQPDGKSIAANIIFTKSPTINGYKPRFKTIVLNPVKKQSQSNPNE